MHRRALLGVVGLSVLFFPLVAAAQQTSTVPVMGVLNAGPVDGRSLNGARQDCEKLGYVEGKTIRLEIRQSKGNPEVLPAQAAELVQKKVDVILAIGPAALKAAAETTRTIPIVAYDLESDPVRSGYARSLYQPGGDVTGLFLDLPDLTGKWLELIREVAPGTRRVALLWDPTTSDRQLAAAKAAGHGLGIEILFLQAQNSDQLEQVLGSGVKGKPGALVQLSSPLFERHQKQIADFALKHHLPAISISSRFTDAGGLIAYGPVRPEFGRRLGTYIEILKDAKPGDLPIEQPSKFELTVNRKAAKALGLTLPPSLLGRADHVIE